MSVNQPLYERWSLSSTNNNSVIWEGGTSSSSSTFPPVFQAEFSHIHRLPRNLCVNRLLRSNASFSLAREVRRRHSRKALSFSKAWSGRRVTRTKTKHLLKNVAIIHLVKPHPIKGSGPISQDGSMLPADTIIQGWHFQGRYFQIPPCTGFQRSWIRLQHVFAEGSTYADGPLTPVFRWAFGGNPCSAVVLYCKTLPAP